MDRVVGWMDGRTDGRMDGRTDGSMAASYRACIAKQMMRVNIAVPVHDAVYVVPFKYVPCTMPYI